MSRPAVLGAVEYEAETANTGWAEDVDTFSLRLNVQNPVDFSGIVHSQIPNTATTQYMGEWPEPIVGTQSGEFTTDLFLPGHGTTTAGAISAREYETLLANVIGTSTSTGTGTTATGGTAGTPTTTSASGFAAGGVVFVGASGDGRASGQAGVVGSHGSNNLVLLNELPAAPANTDVIASSNVVHPYEAVGSTSVRSYRFRLLTANLQISCHGCWPKSIRFSGLGSGEKPMVSITWGVSRWKFVSATFPSTVTPETYTPAPCAGGSLHWQTVGTATRNAYKVRNFEFNVDLGIIPQDATGGFSQYQTTVGAVRGQHAVTGSFVLNEETVTTTPAWASTWWTAPGTNKLLVYTLSGAATGKRMAFVCPAVKPDGPAPMTMNDNGANALRVAFRACTGATTTSALTQSSYRIAFG